MLRHNCKLVSLWGTERAKWCCRAAHTFSSAHIFGRTRLRMMAWMSGEQLPTAEYYRKVAEEIRQLAERTQAPEVRRELLDLVERFNRMAQHIERRYPWRTGQS
jgi:hypothetical protein